MTDWTELAESMVIMIRHRNVDRGDAVSLLANVLAFVETAVAFDRANSVTAAVLQGRAPTLEEIISVIQPKEEQHD